MKIVDRTLEKKALKFITKGLPRSNWLLGSLSDDDFGNPDTRAAFKRIRKIAKQKSEIITWDDLLHDPSLSDKTRAALALYKSKVKVDKATAKSIQRNLEKFRRSRTQFAGIEEIAKEFQKDAIDNDDIDEKLAAIIAKSRSKAGEAMKTFTTGVGNNSTSLVKAILTGTSGLTFIPTGFKAFDNVNHGIHLGSLFVIGGTTGGGKTALALKLQSNFADSGAKTCIVSLEMGEEEVMVRNLSRFSKVSVQRLIDPKSLSKEEKKKVIHAYKARVSSLKAKNASETIHTPQEDMTLEDILFILKSYAYDVIIIDYISLLKNAGGDDAWQKLGDIARFAKVFAKNNKCIVVLLAQVNPEGMIRYSKAVEEHANNAWYFVRDAKSWENHILSIMQKKCRMGKMFPFDLLEEFEFMDVRDVPKEYLEELERQGNAPTQTRGGGKESRFGKKKEISKEPLKVKKKGDEADYFDNIEKRRRYA